MNAWGANLPRCIDGAAALELVRASAKANPNTEAKYEGYRKLLDSEDGTSLLARLVYAETLAANCPEKNRAIAPLIATVIGNRVKKRHGEVSRVVFQRNQFSSSLNHYSESRYREFLCPRDEALWTLSFESANVALNGNEKPALSADTVNYYLYRHSPRFRAPDWKLAEDSASEKGLASCIRFFRNPKWK